MVNVLLNALAPVARSQCAARRSVEQACFHALSLSVVGDVLDDNTPFIVDVLCTLRTGIQNLAWANVTLATYPVTLIESVAFV